jgi:hypothetical protein
MYNRLRCFIDSSGNQNENMYNRLRCFIDSSGNQNENMYNRLICFIDSISVSVLKYKACVYQA